MSGYNEHHDTLFIHVPKTAGTSMEQAPFVSGEGHEPYWAIPETIRERAGFSFGFVRNPYDRLVSAVTAGMYRELRRSGSIPRRDAERQQVFAAGKELVTQAAHMADQPTPLELGNTVEWRILGRGDDPLPHLDGWPFPIHFVPQHYYLAAPGDGGIGVDFVGRFEDLAADWQRICERIGVSYQLPHERNSQADRGRSWAEFLTPETRDIVRRLYARDFELFGYDPLA